MTRFVFVVLKWKTCLISLGGKELISKLSWSLVVADLTPPDVSADIVADLSGHILALLAGNVLALLPGNILTLLLGDHPTLLPRHVLA